LGPLHGCSRSRLQRGGLGGVRSGSRGSGNSRCRRGGAGSASAASTLRDRKACCEREEAGEQECEGEEAMHNRQTLTETGRSSVSLHARRFALLSGVAHFPLWAHCSMHSGRGILRTAAAAARLRVSGHHPSRTARLPLQVCGLPMGSKPLIRSSLDLNAIIGLTNGKRKSASPLRRHGDAVSQRA